VEVIGVVRKKAVVIQPQNEKTLEEAFEQFIQAKTVMNLSKSTIGNYRNIFGYFKDFFGEGRRCAEVSQNTIFEYLAWLKEEKAQCRAPDGADLYQGATGNLLLLHAK